LDEVIHSIPVSGVGGLAEIAPTVVLPTGEITHVCLVSVRRSGDRQAIVATVPPIVWLLVGDDKLASLRQEIAQILLSLVLF
jgi:hypothetical protein